MAKKQTVKSILKKLTRDRQKRFAFEAKQRIDEFANYQKRTSRGEKNLERILQKGLQAGGLNPQFIEKLHEKDDRSAETFAKKQLKEVKRYATDLASHRKKSAGQMQVFLKKNFGKHAGNPVVIAPMKTATQIITLETSAGSSSITPPQKSTGPWNNSVQTTLTAGSNSSFGIENFINFYDFAWQSSVTGIAVVDAWIKLDGLYSLSASGKCIGTRKAGVLIRAGVNVSQPISSSGLGEYTEETIILDEEISAGCTSRSRSGVLDNESFRILSKSGIPIVANLPTIVTVYLSIYCSASKKARTTVDAESQSNFGLNVPNVTLVVDY